MSRNRNKHLHRNYIMCLVTNICYIRPTCQDDMKLYPLAEKSCQKRSELLGQYYYTKPPKTESHNNTGFTDVE